MGGQSFPQEERLGLENKTYWFFAILIGAMILLLLRAWHLQVRQGEYYLALSENNRLRFVETPPPRGRIFDRHGAVLVKNIPSFNLYLVLGDIQKPEIVLQRLSGIIGLTPDEINTRLESRKKRDSYFPIKIKEDLSMTEVAQIEGHGLQLPGVKVEAEFKRHAPGGNLAAHLLGYVGEIRKDQLTKTRYQAIKSGDIIGQYGIEQSYDEMLRGTSGEKKIEVDVLGHERQVVKERLPLRGDDLHLSLDLKLQEAAEDALSNQPGVIVALDPNNGDVLAMVSHPAFDPNVLSKRLSSKDWNAILQDKDRPLTNRAIRGQYPPGSTFKIIVSAALLATKTVSATDSINCKGSIRFGKRDFKDWKKWGHGTTDLHKSLVESCDVYYYEMGQKIGVDTISKYSLLFGLGKPTGIDLPYEKGGLIPNKAWKKKHFNEPWYPGETLSVSIGQGFISVTPLQLATMIAAIAGDGIWHQPQILKKRRDSDTNEIKEIEAVKGRQIPISKTSLQTIQNALAGVLTEKHGTARKTRSEVVSIAGKTGTAQVVGRETIEFDEVPKELADHAWFVAYAPVLDPKIAVVVLVEHGGHGGSAAAPLARRVIEAYFGSEEPEASKDDDRSSPIEPEAEIHHG